MVTRLGFGQRGAMFTRSEMGFISESPSKKNMLTGLFQRHIGRVSMPTLSRYHYPQSREA